MKILALIIALFFTVNSIAVAPYGFRGQNQTAVQYSNVLQFPNSQVTKLSGINSLVETGNKNILLNPDFENNTFNSSWTATTVTPAVETTTVISGKKSVIMTPSAQTFTFVQDSTLYASNFQGSTQLLAMVWIRTNQNGIKVCSRNDGVTSTTNCATVAPQSSSVWQLIKVPFISSSTSNGISIAASSAITGNVYIDDAFVGAVDLKTDSVQIQTQTSFITQGSTFSNATITGAETSTSGSGVYTYVSGTGIYTALRAALVNVSASFSATGAAGPEVGIVKNGSIVVARSNGKDAASNYASASASFPVIAGDTFLIRNSIAVSSNAQVITVSATNTVNSQIYSASCGANCVSDFGAQVVTTSGLVTGENSDFINGNCTAANPTVCTFNTGIFTVTPNCTAQSSIGGGSTVIVNIAAQSSTSISLQTINSSSGANVGSAPFTLLCQKQGADFVASRTIVGSFAEVMTVPGVSRPEHFSVSYGTTNVNTACTASPCFIDQIGNLVSSITRSSVASYVMNLTKTYSKLKCTMVGGTTGGFSANVYANSLNCSACSTLAFVPVRSSDGSGLDSFGTLMCDGIP